MSGIEPVESEVIVHNTTVTNVEPRGDTHWVFSLDNMNTMWIMTGEPSLAIGDRVRITITKEPVDG